MKTTTAIITVSNENTGEYIEIRTNNEDLLDDPYIFHQMMKSLAVDEYTDVFLISKNHNIR